ncbi:MAG TPA: hypothetical protein V6D08_03045 [Candidatus Obscuribacterales bacterium]
MRVELVYTPECTSVPKLLDMLEVAVAEAGLPLAIEVVRTQSIREQSTSHAGIRIDGLLVSEITSDRPEPTFVDRVWELLTGKWRECTDPLRLRGD